MQRRDFIRLLGGAAVAWPFAARAQQSDRVRRTVVLMAATADDADYQARIAAFQQGLQQLGWSDGRNVHVDIRWATTKPDDIAGTRPN
jgi:putative ABC transport system substrate-binding protein